MAKQLSEKEASQLLSQLKSLNSQAKGVKGGCLKSAFDQIEKPSSKLCTDNKDMPAS